VISETTGQYFELGQYIGFVTVLIPHAKGEDAESLIDGIRFVDSDNQGDGMSVEILKEGKKINLGVKCDLRMDMVRDYRRPKYTYESGRISFGEFESNGDFFFTEEKDGQFNYTIVNLTKAIYQGEVLFDQAQGFFGLAFDGSPDVSGAGKARYWRGRIELK